jgi:hypothetical protein
MDTYNETKKLAIYKWREKNREKYNDVCLKAVKKYNEKNKTEIQEYKRKYWIDKKDIYKVESTIFRKILL